MELPFFHRFLCIKPSPERMMRPVGRRPARSVETKSSKNVAMRGKGWRIGARDPRGGGAQRDSSNVLLASLIGHPMCLGAKKKIKKINPSVSPVLSLFFLFFWLHTGSPIPFPYHTAHVRAQQTNNHTSATNADEHDQKSQGRRLFSV